MKTVLYPRGLVCDRLHGLTRACGSVSSDFKVAFPFKPKFVTIESSDLHLLLWTHGLHGKQCGLFFA